MKRAATVIGLCIALTILNFVPLSPKTHRAPEHVFTVQAIDVSTVNLSTLKAVAFHERLAQEKAAAAWVVHWQLGFSIQSGWLCYGWGAPSWVYHCTLSWHYVNGKPISLNPGFVPLPASTSTTHTVNYVNTTPSGSSSSGGWSYKFLAGEPCQSLDFGNQNDISQWSVPPSCYGNIYYPNPYNFRIGPNGDFGWCNWWPQALRPQYPTIWDDPYRGSVPRPGATVFYSGDVQGASNDGHFGVVVAVSPGGYWVLTTEMNFYWRGGGWQRVDYRYIHVGWGVTFLY